MPWIAAAIVFFILCWFFLVAPGRPSPEARRPFDGRLFAHRGLYEKDQSVPENSLPAFRRAVEAGYGAELDVQETKDGRIVVFHDDDLERACGKEGRICDYTFEELQAFPLFRTEERIPLFADVLEIFGGKQPLIVELKAVPDNDSLCRKTCAMLRDYAGPACVESFHPGIVTWFRKNDPARLRGQLSQPARFYLGGKKPFPKYLAFGLSRLLTNCASRPGFIAYKLGPKPVSVRLCEAMGAMKVCWTANRAEEHDRVRKANDAVIFEHYRPEN